MKKIFEKLTQNFDQTWQGLTSEQKSAVVTFVDEKVYSDYQCGRYAIQRFEYLCKQMIDFVDENLMQKYKQSKQANLYVEEYQNKHGIDDVARTNENILKVVYGHNSITPTQVDELLLRLSKKFEQQKQLLEKNQENNLTVFATRFFATLQNSIAIENKNQDFYAQAMKFVSKLKTEQEKTL